MNAVDASEPPNPRLPWTAKSPLVGAFLISPVLREWDEAVAHEMLSTLAAAGVNAVCTEGGGYRNEVIDWVHKAGMAFIGGISCFSEYETGNAIVYEHPELWPILETGARRESIEGYLGVVPTIDWYRDERIRLAERLVREHRLDGLFLDFVRWPLHWEIELRPGAGRPLQSSFDDHTLARFREATGVDFPRSPTGSAETAHWILEHAADAWHEFRCSVITRFVADVTSAVRSVRDDLPIGAYVVPLRPRDLAQAVGQQLSEIERHVDLIAPMLYHAMVHRPASWVAEVCRELTSAFPTRVVATLQVDSAEGPQFGSDWGPPMPPTEWETVASHALDAGVVGLIGWTGTAMLQLERRQRLARALKARRLIPARR
jgi:hypothetical protein